MPKNRQEILLFIEPNEDSFLTPQKIARSFSNLFVINEHAGFELTGIHYLHYSSFKMESTINPFLISEKGMNKMNASYHFVICLTVN